MAASTTCLIFLFLFPCFTISCNSTLPCNHSIQIMSPFFFRPDIATDPSCQRHFPVTCDNHGTPLFERFSRSFPLESISYDTSTIRVQDPNLSSSLEESGCSNLNFTFSTPVNYFGHKYKLLNASLLLLRCEPPNQIQSPLKTLGKDYNLSYSPFHDKDDKLPQNCLRADNSQPLFEFILSFQEDKLNLSLLSASYSRDLLAQPGCFANSTEVFNCEGCKDKHPRRRILLVSATGGASIFIFTCLIFSFKLQRCKNCTKYIFSSEKGPEGNIDMLIEKYGSLAPKRYKYAEVKKITHSFQDTLGKGGFGTVYKGNLQDGRLVAVKILHNSRSHGDEFLNEVISIGRTSHVNVVSLLGFCIEGSKHALIYEYMPNGSLDNYIYSENSRRVLGWEKLYEIVIGIARGLEYLHRGCNARIVHFDIKPQNILLDEDFNPKIADFGLAKLCPPKESIISMAEMRGTIGFIAPEVFSRSFGVVSAKSDVYSYGMMVLEMVGGKRNAKQSAENSSEVYFPHWLYDRLVEDGQIESCDVAIVTDEIARKMGIVGLWCMQIMPVHRPSMSRVVEMLERGLDELEMPPKPSFSSPPHLTIISTSSSILS